MKKYLLMGGCMVAGIAFSPSGNTKQWSAARVPRRDPSAIALAHDTVVHAERKVAATKRARDDADAVVHEEHVLFTGMCDSSEELFLTRVAGRQPTVQDLEALCQAVDAVGAMRDQLLGSQAKAAAAQRCYQDAKSAADQAFQALSE